MSAPMSTTVAPPASSAAPRSGKSCVRARSPRLSRIWKCRPCGTPLRCSAPSGRRSRSISVTLAKCRASTEVASRPAMLPPITTASPRLTGSRRAPRIEPLSRLLPQLAARDLVPQDSWRRVLRFPQRLVEVFGDGEPHVQADEVRQLERPHGMVVAQLHRLVDVL